MADAEPMTFTEAATIAERVAIELNCGNYDLRRRPAGLVVWLWGKHEPLPGAVVAVPWYGTYPGQRDTSATIDGLSFCAVEHREVDP